MNRTIEFWENSRLTLGKLYRILFISSFIPKWLTLFPWNCEKIAEEVPLRAHHKQFPGTAAATSLLLNRKDIFAICRLIHLGGKGNYLLFFWCWKLCFLNVLSKKEYCWLGRIGKIGYVHNFPGVYKFKHNLPRVFIPCLWSSMKAKPHQNSELTQNSAVIALWSLQLQQRIR